MGNTHDVSRAIKSWLIENGPRRETRAVCYFSAVQSVTGKPLEINGKTPEFL